MSNNDIIYFSRMSIDRNRPNLIKISTIYSETKSILALTSYGDVIENGMNHTNHPFEKKLRFIPQTKLLGKILNQALSVFYLLYFCSIYKPRILILHDSLLLPVGVFIKKIFNVKLSVDFHEILWDCGYGKTMSKFIKYNEKKFNRYIDFSLFPSKIRQTLIANNCQSSFKYSVVIPNYPYQAFLPKIFDIVKSEQTNEKIIYFGAVNDITYEPLIKLSKIITNLNLYIDFFIFGSKADSLKSHFQGIETIAFKPIVNSHEILNFIPKYLSSICVYDPSHLNNRFCEPRKLYESIYLGIPVIVNDLDGPLSNSLVNKYIIKFDNVKLETLTVAKKDLGEKIIQVRERMDGEMNSGIKNLRNIINNFL